MLTSHAKLELMRLAGAAVPEPSPSLAGWVRDDRPRAKILARIAALIPRIDLGEAKITTILFDVEGCDHVQILRIKGALRREGRTGYVRVAHQVIHGGPNACDDLKSGALLCIDPA